MLNLFTNQVVDIFIARPNAANSKQGNNAYKNKEQFTNTSPSNDAEGIKYL